MRLSTGHFAFRPRTCCCEHLLVRRALEHHKPAARCLVQPCVGWPDSIPPDPKNTNRSQSLRRLPRRSLRSDGALDCRWQVPRACPRSNHAMCASVHSLHPKENPRQTAKPKALWQTPAIDPAARSAAYHRRLWPLSHKTLCQASIRKTPLGQRHSKDLPTGKSIQAADSRQIAVQYEPLHQQSAVRTAHREWRRLWGTRSSAASPAGMTIRRTTTSSSFF